MEAHKLTLDAYFIIIIFIMIKERYYSLYFSFNYVNITLALNFTQYLNAEHDPAGWQYGMIILNRIRHVFYHTKLKTCVEVSVEIQFSYVKMLFL